MTNEDFARATWYLYIQHGMGPYNNYLSMKQERISREDILECLRFEKIRKKARAQIAFYKNRIKEIESLLKETE